MPHGITELFLIGAAVLVGVVGLVAGWRATLRAPIPAALEAPADTGFARVLYRKYYVDEIYDALIVRPLRLALAVRALERGGPGRGRWRGGERHGRGCPAAWAGWEAGSRPGRSASTSSLFLVGALWILRVRGPVTPMTQFLDSIDYSHGFSTLLILLPLPAWSRCCSGHGASAKRTALVVTLARVRVVARSLVGVRSLATAAMQLVSSTPWIPRWGIPTA